MKIPLILNKLHILNYIIRKLIEKLLICANVYIKMLFNNYYHVTTFLLKK